MNTLLLLFVYVGFLSVWMSGAANSNSKNKLLRGTAVNVDHALSLNVDITMVILPNKCILPAATWQGSTDLYADHSREVVDGPNTAYYCRFQTLETRSPWYSKIFSGFYCVTPMGFTTRSVLSILQNEVQVQCIVSNKNANSNKSRDFRDTME